MPSGSLIFKRRSVSVSTLTGVLLAIGLAARLIVAFATSTGGDLYNLSIIHDSLSGRGLHAYDANLVFSAAWTYPPGFFPLISTAGWLSAATGASFLSLIRIPAILCDLAIAWIVQDFLGRRGRGPGPRLVAASSIALGPLFAGVSSYQAQIDSVMLVFAVAGVVLWSSTSAPWRPYAVGVLIGVAATVKTPALLMLLAVAPSAHSVREFVKLAGIAVAIPLLALIPFFIASPTGVSYIFKYRGAPGQGGISLLTGPHLPPYAFNATDQTVAAVGGELSRTLAVYHKTSLILGVALTAAAFVVLRYRVPPLRAAVLVWLTVYVFSVNFFINYWLWGLPFLALAGYLRSALWLQTLLVPAALVIYVGLPTGVIGQNTDLIFAFYTVPMLVGWLAAAIGLVAVVRQVVIEGRRAPPRVVPG